jgi:hypothetical protein
MKSRKKSKKPKQDAAPTGAEGVSKDVLALVDAEDIHALMSINGPKVARWALECVNRAARGRASLFQQKVALLMIQKCTPSTGRKEEEGDDTPEGATKEEVMLLERMIAEEKNKVSPLAPTPARAHAQRADATYQVQQAQAD